MSITPTGRPRSCFWRLAASALICAVSADPMAGAFADDNVVSDDAARRQVIDRLSNLQNIIVEYDETVKYQPLPELLNRYPKRVTFLGTEGVVIIRNDTEKSKCTFRFLSGLAWYERHLQEVEPRTQSRYIEYSVDSYREEQLERLWRHEGGLPQGMIDPYPSRLALPSIIDVALGLRLLYTGANWLTPEDVRHFSFETSQDGRVVVRNPQFRTYEREKTQVTVETVHEWIFDTEQDSALLRYRRIVDGQVGLEMTMGSFDEVDGMRLPTEIHFRRLYRRDGEEPIETEIREIVVTRYALDPAENSPDSFAIDFPEHALVVRGE